MKNLLETIQKTWSVWSQKRKVATVAMASSVLALSIVVAVSLHVHALDKGNVAPYRIDPPVSGDVQQAHADSAAQNELIGPVLASEVAPSEEVPAQPEQPAQPAQEAEANKQNAVPVKAEQKPEQKAPAKEVREHKAPVEHKVLAEQKSEHKTPAPAPEVPKGQPEVELVMATPPKGHWKTVVEKPAWDEPVYEEVPNYEWVGYAVFWADGYRTRGDDTIRHMYKLMDEGKDSSYRTESVKEPRPGTRREYVGMRHHDAITRQVWVED